MNAASIETALADAVMSLWTQAVESSKPPKFLQETTRNLQETLNIKQFITKLLILHQIASGYPMLIKLGLIAAFLLVPATAEAANIKLMNQKLARYVHPTHKCGGASEQLATVYGNGDGHLGKRVSCGGVLDSRRPTVAHKTLPCGTKLTLSNPRNGRSVVATVTDRGPYTIASLDLGPATYRALGTGDNSSYICVMR